MGSFNPTTLGGEDVLQARPGECINFFYSQTGAFKYGAGMFLMRRSVYTKIVESAGTAALTRLSMKSETGGAGLEIDVIIAGAEMASATLGTAANAGVQDSDIVKVVVVDQRYNKLATTTKHYNDLSQPFSWDDDEDQPNYFSETLNAGNPWTWEEIVTNIEGCPVMPEYPSWVPNNLGWDQEHLALVVDDLMSRLYWVVGWDVTGNVWTCNTPGEMNAANTLLFTKASKDHFIAGGAGEKNLNRAPGVLRVSFRAFNADNPLNPYASPSTYARSYTKDVTVGPSSRQQPLPVGQIMAIWQDGDWKNNAEMDTVAADMAPRAYRFMTVTPEEWTFAGIWPFSPDGNIRGVMWISDSTGARTVVRMNNDRDFCPEDDPRRLMETWTNQLIMGLGASNVGFDAGSGVRQIWSTLLPSIAWIKITSPQEPYSVGPPPSGGGGYYNAALVRGTPVTIDPTTNLVAPINPAEVVGTDGSILAMNWYEANKGDPPSHCVECPTFVPAYLLPNASNEDPPRPVYRFYVPLPGNKSLAINFPGSFGGVSVALGTGRYFAGPMIGDVVDQDVTEPFGVDNGTDYVSVGHLPGSVIWQNLAEAQQPALAYPTHAMICAGRDSLVDGWFAGSTLVDLGGDETLIPVYYGWATLATWPVDVYAVSGTGTPGDPFVYDVYAFGTLPPDVNYKLASGQNPTERPFPSVTVTAATHGLAWQRNGGVGVVLFYVYEQPAATGLTGTYVISGSLGGSVVLDAGTIIDWVPAL